MRPYRRKPSVSGIFYSSAKEELVAELEGCFMNKVFGPGRLPPTDQVREIYGLVSPHAGYLYSGAVAANGYYNISSSTFDSVILVGPNHYGLGSDVATTMDGIWESPLGEVAVNQNVANDIASKATSMANDEFAHSRDHCLEVQIPFLLYTFERFRIVPIILTNQDEYIAHELGSAISDAVKDGASKGKKFMLIASSDFTHYESNAEAHRKDSQLIKSILSLDVGSFYSNLRQYNVSACGYGAIATIMVAAKNLGATQGQLLRYATSGDVMGDTSSVVGYSSILFV
ncbi:MAG TPA: MEMO1 family protein [Nitrososphaeraceae archaeon]|nr:MEMO1 family protein [Nitrososphaeraceae archaeon]